MGDPATFERPGNFRARPGNGDVDAFGDDLGKDVGADVHGPRGRAAGRARPCAPRVTRVQGSGFRV